MLKTVIFFVFLGATLACKREPTIYQSRIVKLPGDNGIHLKINENPTSYVPGNVYTMTLMASDAFNKNQRFTKFMITIENKENGNNSPDKVGSFQLFRNSPVTFNFDCINTLSETNSSLKSEVFFMWTAPPPGSGCVTFRSMVFLDAYHWYADDGHLELTICEQSDKEKMTDPEECCACDEAKYSMIFEGLWSSKTHPKDFPTLLWLTHFSDVIGASHERNFSFWGEGQISSEGFRSLAEWGSVRLMETELKAKSKYLRTIIKAAGLWHPNVNTNTSANFKVDRKHSHISLASMFGPTPDWVVGVNGLNLCLKNCSWQENLEIDLFPYDAGTDSGITYMSPNSETSPRERMYRITTTYPEDPRAPFYNPSTKEMPPLAKLHLKREKIIPRNCDENFLSAQVDISENTEETSRAECAVTDYSNWSACSVTCGKGLRMRTREYRIPQKAVMFNCNRQLISKEMCVAETPECPNNENNEDKSLSIEDGLDDNIGGIMGGICTVSPWGLWSECSEKCGLGFKMRTRHFVDRMGMKKCPSVTLTEKHKCMGPPCKAGEILTNDPMCPTTQWSDWSPCSATCGKGIRFRTRLLLVEPNLQIICSSKVELMQQSTCSERDDCTLDLQTAKGICMQKSDFGSCNGYINRWFFDSTTLECLPFIYGGCKGNQNNFLTFQECMQTCKAVKGVLQGSNISPATSGPLETDAIDCMVTAWSSWSTCTTSCGVGLSESVRIVKRPPGNGGRPCPQRLSRKKKCMGPPCG